MEKLTLDFYEVRQISLLRVETHQGRIMANTGKRGYLAIYGNIAIVKGYCQSCQQLAFILEGHLACCCAPYEAEPKRLKREIPPQQERQHIPLAFRRAQLELQENRCFYCNIQFGSFVMRGSRSIRLKLEWDHYAPFALTQDSRPSNIVAACHICNHIKSDLVFQTSGEAVAYVTQKRTEKGYV